MFSILLPLLLVLAALAFVALMVCVVISVAKADRAQAAVTRVNAEVNRQESKAARQAAFGYVAPPALRR